MIVLVAPSSNVVPVLVGTDGASLIAAMVILLVVEPVFELASTAVTVKTRVVVLGSSDVFSNVTRRAMSVTAASLTPLGGFACVTVTSSI